MYIYTLRIHVEEDQYSSISEALGVLNNSTYGWAYELIVEDDHGNLNFIEYFLKLLEGKEKCLMDIGASPEQIEFWMVYRYKDQCNMEFAPVDLKNLGEKGYSLCISCYSI